MDWDNLRYANHSKDKLYQASQKFYSDPSEENLTEVLDCLVTLVHWVIDDSFWWIKDCDRDDVVSEVVYKLYKELDYYANWEKRTFSALLWTSVKRLIIDYLRAHCKPGIEQIVVDPLQVTRKVQAPVPKQVDAKLILEDLPRQIASYALARDRFGFGGRVLLIVVELLVKGKKVPEPMLNNWYHVSNPRLCINFVKLMIRAFLHTYRNKFADLIDEKSTQMIDEVGQRIIVEGW